ncbi:Os05g0482650, partial [Oryza sativa Japonica Group]
MGVKLLLKLYVAEALLRGAHGEGPVAAGADLPPLQLPHAVHRRLVPRPLPRHHPPPAARPRARRDPPRLHPLPSPPPIQIASRLHARARDAALLRAAEGLGFGRRAGRARL